MKKYITVWWTSSKLTASSFLSHRLGAAFFLMGKWIRFLFFIYFIFLIGGGVKQIQGYSTSDLVTFFLVFNLFDLLGQFLFRGIYWFREQVVSGEFDFRLIKPMNPLFQALTRQTDILDLPMLITVIIALIVKFQQASISQIGSFILMSLAASIVLTGVHIMVAALGVMTTEVDHTMMIYRDLSAMARFPIDIYATGIRALLTFVIPVAIAYTLPAKALMGLITPLTLMVSLAGSLFFFGISLRLWNYALTQYSSASS